MGNDFLALKWMDLTSSQRVIDVFGFSNVDISFWFDDCNNFV